MSGRRLLVALLAVAVGAAVLGVLPSSPPAYAAPADPASSDSAVTVSGKGEFADLKVTVSQTKNLINQTVTVSWTGGKPTVPANGQFGVNYLQIMQCWGEDPGPDRTQCQYGGSSTQSTPDAGTFVRSRQVSYDPPLVDSQEELKGPPGDVYVPFWPVGQEQPTGPGTSDINSFFDSQVTNEIPLARTHDNGTGQEFFEVQTVRQAAGLGCGDPVTVGGLLQGRSCWLVIVPRGTTEVNTSRRAGQRDTDRLDSSPLSRSNWDNRIVFPLQFLPVGQACPIGSPERRVIGHELAADAVSSWQPALCAGGGALFSYTQLPDDVARSQVLDGSSPGLALMTNPIPPEQAPPERPLVYAPVGLSGLTIAFNIEHQPGPGAPQDKQQLDGQRFLSMKLTPRLVAKLLSQSYRGAVASRPDYLKNNPIGLTVDPEFLALNPDYAGFATGNVPSDALVQLNGSDVTSLLWSWVQADPDARAFLAGKPDESGMVVNPNNKGLTLPTSTFPRNDQSCLDTVIDNGIPAQSCTLDSHPFTLDMHDAGRSASRGDSQARDPARLPDGTLTTKKVSRQNPGQRALLAVVDAATAIRYGLPTAELRNAAGQFVAPTTASLLAGEAAMKPSAVAGVLASDPGATDPAAYPLTALSYAVASPSTVDAAAGKDYAAFLRYAADPGQQPGIAAGQLPLGMVPLPEELRAQTTAAAATVEAQAGKTATGTAAQQATAGSVTGPTAAATGGQSGAASTGGGRTAAGTPAKQPPGAAPAGAAGQAAKAPTVAQQSVAGVRRTPALPAPAVGALLVGILVCGALAAASSPVMHLLSTRVGRWERPTER